MSRTRLEELELWYSDLMRKRDNVNKEISKTLIEIARTKLSPFAEGQIVKCVIPAGRSKKEARCQIEIDENGQVWVRPIKEDGGLGGRRFKAIPEDGKTYKDIFKEADR